MKQKKKTFGVVFSDYRAVNYATETERIVELYSQNTAFSIIFMKTACIIYTFFCFLKEIPLKKHINFIGLGLLTLEPAYARPSFKSTKFQYVVCFVNELYVKRTAKEVNALRFPHSAFFSITNKLDNINDI